MQKEVRIETNCEIPKDFLATLKNQGAKIEVTQKNFEYGEGFNFPFRGYPSKLKTENWANWKKRCEEMGFDVNGIQKEDVVDLKYDPYRFEETRREADVALFNRMHDEPYNASMLQ